MSDPGPVGRVVLVALWAVVAVLPLALGVGDVRLAAGAVGTSGTLTVEQCLELGRGRYDCDGVFVPDDGSPPVRVDASPDSTAGEVVAAQLDPDRDRAVPTGTSGVLAALTVPCLGLAALGLLPAVAMWGTRRTRGIRPALFWGVVVAVVGLGGVVAGLVASSVA